MHADPSGASVTAFHALLPNPALLTALDEAGYESPSPIQAATIPHLLAGTDVVGQAQTGTGKTAAFALPLLSRIEVHRRAPQALVLVPTRELAMQVAEAFRRYAAHLEGFEVLAVYGGQPYAPQLQRLERGVHVVVGTPGRVLDHLERGTLDPTMLRHVVLDEADEMLRMGFIEDVEWILQQVPEDRQMALFSATMPPAVRRIAQRHLRAPVELTMQGKTDTASRIRQRYCVVGAAHKFDALTRILETEAFDAMLVFTRTKLATEALTQQLTSRGFAAEALNGDLAQAQRERTIARLKAGQIDIVVATDVAARGLDVERVSHVLNYDIPHDPESYVHRIGRTGRAGRSGEAILFIAPRERRMLRVMERATRQPLEPMELPTLEEVNQRRVARFYDRIGAALRSGEAEAFRGLIERYEREHGVAALDIAAALASIAQGRPPLQVTRGDRDDAERATSQGRRGGEPGGHPTTAGASRAAGFEPAPEGRRAARPHRPAADAGRARRPAAAREWNMETFRVEVGRAHGVQPGNIVGAIANEAGLGGEYIGRVVIREDHSFVELPEGMPKDIFRQLQKTRVAGQKLQISRALKTQVESLRRSPGRARTGRARQF